VLHAQLLRLKPIHNPVRAQHVTPGAASDTNGLRILLLLCMIGILPLTWPQRPH
jgi:hypothetical protein